MFVRLVFGFGDGGQLFSFNPFVAIAALAVGAIALGGAPRLVVLVARLKAHSMAYFLGPDQLAAAERRVSTLAEQRQDILDAVACERRRIERNLHDGVQQQLVAIGLDLGMAEHHLDNDPAGPRVDRQRPPQGAGLDRRDASDRSRPAPGDPRGPWHRCRALGDRDNAPIPISVHVDPDLDLSQDVAETVYFIVNEAVANMMKHAKARVASVHVTKVGDDVRVTVHDDGVGGVDPQQGHRHRRHPCPHQRCRRHGHRELAARRPDHVIVQIPRSGGCHE